MSKLVRPPQGGRPSGTCHLCGEPADDTMIDVIGQEVRPGLPDRPMVLYVHAACGQALEEEEE